MKITPYILSQIMLILVISLSSVKTVGEDPLFEIDLDLPHLERWREVISAKGQVLKQFAYKYKEHANVTEELAEQFVRYGELFPEMASNMQAISTLSGVDLPTLYTLNFMYELETMACTSVIIRQTDNTLFHARNLDYDFQDEISSIAILIKWKRAGKIIYQSETLVGFVSLITVSKLGQFSISVNYRYLTDSTQDNIDALINKHYVQAIYLPLLVVEQANTFEEALEMFKNVNVSSPIYFILSGLEGNQGAIIERNRSNYSHVYTLSDKDWFLVQTNVDLDKQSEKNFRLRQTIKSIQKLGQENCSPDNLLQSVMSVFPTKNSMTISTSIYSALDGNFISRNYFINNNNNNTTQIQSNI